MENSEKYFKKLFIAEGGMTTDMLANLLDELQKEKNSGRGVSCVQEIVMWLRKGDIGKARAVATHDADKIHDTFGRYRDIEELIKTELFRGENEHPWSFLEMLQKEKEGRVK